jgi:hypothetical protein
MLVHLCTRQCVYAARVLHDICVTWHSSQKNMRALDVALHSISLCTALTLDSCKGCADAMAVLVTAHSRLNNCSGTGYKTRSGSVFKRRFVNQ